MGQPRAKLPKIDLSQYEMAFKLLVSPHIAGKIIGRGGSEIAAMRQQLGVGCHIHGPENLYPRSGCQVCVLLGSRPNIESALEGVIAKMVEAEGQAFEGSLTVPVVMAKNTVSMVIGTKGATIASLRQQSGCQIVAEKDCFGGEQVLRLTGSAETMPQALALVTPFVERSGESLSLALQDYTVYADAEWGPPPTEMYGKGKGKGQDYSGGKGFGWGPPPGKGGDWGPPPGKGNDWDWGPPGGEFKGWGPPKGKGADWGCFGGGPPKGVGKGSCCKGKVPAGGFGPARPAAMALQGRPKGKTFGKGSSWGKPDGDEGYQEEEFKQLLGDLESAEDASQEAGPQDGGPAPLDGESLEQSVEEPEILNSQASISFTIPGDRIGRVLGKGGGSSREIRRLTGVKLQIECGPGEGTVTLVGPLREVHRAHCMVISRVMSEF